jgi:hypothetical protein
MAGSDDRPRWIRQVHSWVNTQLDERDAAFHPKIVSAAKTYVALVDRRLSRLNNGEMARRKHDGLAKTQAWLEQLATDRNDVEALRRLFPTHARLINQPRGLKRGEHFKKPPPHPARVRLEQALAELPHARALLKKFYEWESARPLRGQVTAEQVLAGRWDLDEKEIRKRRPSRERLKRERASSDE